VRVWVIPSFDTPLGDLDTPDFGQNNEAPF